MICGGLAVIHNCRLLGLVVVHNYVHNQSVVLREFINAVYLSLTYMNLHAPALLEATAATSHIFIHFAAFKQHIMPLNGSYILLLLVYNIY